MYMIIERLIDETNDLLKSNERDVRIVLTTPKDLARDGYESKVQDRREYPKKSQKLSKEQFTQEDLKIC